MPSLVPGYSIEIPPAGASSRGYVADDDLSPEQPTPGRPQDTHALIVNDRFGVGALLAPPAPVELRVPGVERVEGYAVAEPPHFTRSPLDFGNDRLYENRHGVHVAQTAGAIVAHDSNDPEPPMYGSTWRLEPQPASAGWYIGNEAQ